MTITKSSMKNEKWFIGMQIKKGDFFFFTKQNVLLPLNIIKHIEHGF